jgi:hypothetical protein
VTRPRSETTRSRGRNRKNAIRVDSRLRASQRLACRLKRALPAWAYSRWNSHLSTLGHPFPPYASKRGSKTRVGEQIIDLRIPGAMRSSTPAAVLRPPSPGEKNRICSIMSEKDSVFRNAFQAMFNERTFPVRKKVLRNLIIFYPDTAQ